MWLIAAWMLLIAGGVGMDADSPATYSAPGPSAPQVIEPNSYAQERYFLTRAPVVLFSSRVGRGKSYIACAKDYVYAQALPGIQIALTRLERVSMENTTLETLKKLVPPTIWARGWSESKSCLSFPPVKCDDGKVRQSKIWVFGWLNPERALSAEFARVTVDQAEQIDQRHYTTAQTRLRQNDPWLNARAAELGLAARQMSLLCNPEDDEHWIARMFEPDLGARELTDDAGNLKAEVILSGYHDNEQNLPDDYRARLEAERGSVHHDRLVLGLWKRAEGLVFPMYDPARHLVPRPAEWAAWNGFPPPNWERYRGIDFGYRNAFVCLWLAKSPEGVFHVYREWSMGGRLYEDQASEIKRLEQEELLALRNAPALSSDNASELRPYLQSLYIRSSIADSADPEGIATLARHGVSCSPAIKDRDACRRAIYRALNTSQLVILNDSLVQEDPEQVRAKVPTSLARELKAARWRKVSERALAQNDELREDAEKKNDHRIDALGYLLHGLDRAVKPSVWVG